MAAAPKPENRCGCLDPHHTSFSYAVTPAHLRDFAEMAGIEFLSIDEHTRLEEFKNQLRWNEAVYH